MIGVLKVLELKSLLSPTVFVCCLTAVPDHQVILFQGKRLQDDKTLLDYEIGTDKTVFVIPRVIPRPG